MRTRRSFLFSSLALSAAAALPSVAFGSAESFPRVTARNLNQEDVPLPAGFAAASRNLVFVAFDRSQHEDVETWARPLASLTGKPTQLTSWQATVMGEVEGSLRPIVESAMRGIVKDEEARRRHLLLYGDRADLLARLGSPREDAILMLLTDASGDLLWQGRGAHSDLNEQMLRFALRA